MFGWTNKNNIQTWMRFKIYQLILPGQKGNRVLSVDLPLLRSLADCLRPQIFLQWALRHSLQPRLATTAKRVCLLLPGFQFLR